ncbi:MAG: ADP-glyceromanno-heptose 6-epimerase [Acidimicrobiia bacterium]
MSAPIVVTGASGFIGRNTVAALNRRGVSNILLVDRLHRNEKWRNLRGLEYEDLIEPPSLFHWLESTEHDVETIIHLGACTSTTETDAAFLLENNYRYTRRLCEWALANNCRFIYASSAATYGDGSAGYSDADDVTPQLRPLNMYGYSKHMFDLWALRHRLFDRIVGLKFFNVFGPYEGHKGDMRSVVAKAYEEVTKTGHISLFKSYRDGIAHGEQRRDFIYVDDAVKVILHFVDHRDEAGLVNCGTGRARTWLDLARAVFSGLELEPNIRFIDMPEALRDKYQYFTEARVDKLRATGFQDQFVELEDGIGDYLRTYLTPGR